MAYCNQHAGILSEDKDPGLDADIIMTAAVVGFSAGRLAVGHPVQFSSGKKIDQDLQGTVNRINLALGS